MTESQRTRRVSFRSQSRGMRRERARLTSAANSVNKMTRPLAKEGKKRRGQRREMAGARSSFLLPPPPLLLLPALLFISLYRGCDDARRRNRSCAASSADEQFPYRRFLTRPRSAESEKNRGFPFALAARYVLHHDRCSRLHHCVAAVRGTPATACPLRAHCVPTAWPSGVVNNSCEPPVSGGTLSLMRQ